MSERPEMLGLQFLDGVTDPNEQRYRTQTVSDIYKSIQTRLDGYRQSAGAVFLGFFAALLTLDSALARMFIDPTFFNAIPATQTTHLAFVAFGAAFIIIVLGFLGALMIDQIGLYFAEMTSIIYKIDNMNKVFTPGVWLPDVPLYPRNFQATDKVGRDAADVDLLGWRDPSINWFRNLTISAVVLHLAVFGISICLWTRS